MKILQKTEEHTDRGHLYRWFLKGPNKFVQQSVATVLKSSQEILEVFSIILGTLNNFSQPNLPGILGTFRHQNFIQFILTFLFMNISTTCSSGVLSFLLRISWRCLGMIVAPWFPLRLGQTFNAHIDMHDAAALLNFRGPRCPRNHRWCIPY